MWEVEQTQTYLPAFAPKNILQFEMGIEKKSRAAFFEIFLSSVVFVLLWR
jgi:hypothetical protein